MDRECVHVMKVLESRTMTATAEAGCASMVDGGEGDERAPVFLCSYHYHLSSPIPERYHRMESAASLHQEKGGDG